MSVRHTRKHPSVRVIQGTPNLPDSKSVRGMTPPVTDSGNLFRLFTVGVLVTKRPSFEPPTDQTSFESPTGSGSRETMVGPTWFGEESVSTGVSKVPFRTRRGYDHR